MSDGNGGNGDGRARPVHYVVGGIVSAFLAEIGKHLFQRIIGGEWNFGLVFEKPGVAGVESALYALLQIAMWLAIFGGIAAISLGIAATTKRIELVKYCHATASACHFLANCFVVFLAIRELAGLA